MDVTETLLHSLFSTTSYVNFEDIVKLDAAIQSIDDAQRLPESTSSWLFETLGWAILSQQPNDLSGFSATLFTNGSQKILAIRGTELDGFIDTYQDLLQTDLAEIGLLGIAASQAVALFNYVQRLQAAAGTTDVLQLTLRQSDIPPSGQFIDLGELATGRYLWLEPSHTGQGLGLLQTGDQVTVTGHSLGGHLAAVALRLFPDVFTEAFTFNAAGFDPAISSSRITDQFVGLFEPFTTTSPASSFGLVADRIHTLESESSGPGDDLEAVSSDLTGSPPSPETYVVTEKNSHSIDQLVDTLAVQSLLAELSPALSLAQIGDLYAAASRDAGATDERIVEALSKLLLNDPTPLPLGESPNVADGADFEARTALHDRIAALRTRVDQSGVTLQSLLDPGNADLVAKASMDIAYRYALVALQPFALTGDPMLYEAHDGGSLALHDPLTRTGELTTDYLADRAHLLRQVLARNTADSIVAPDGPYTQETYADIPSGIAFSTDASHFGPEPPPDYRRYVFDGELPSTLEGGSADDRLYAGGGDDVLRGGSGSDYLEGGRGFDTYWWNTGDGVDRILDTDGNGRVLLDGSLAGGGRRIAEGLYRNTAGTMTYAWQPAEGAESATLVINGVVRVEHFRNGDLGIILDPTAPAAPARDYGLVGSDEADALVFEDVQAIASAAPLTASIQSAGGGGNDLLITVDGADLVDGGPGDDLIVTGAEADSVTAGDGSDLVFTGTGRDDVDAGAGDDLVLGNQYLRYDTSGSAAEDEQAWEDLQGRFRWVNDGLDLTDDGFLQVLWHFDLPDVALEGVSATTGRAWRYDPATQEIHYLDAQGGVVRTLAHEIDLGGWENADAKAYAGGAGSDLLAGADGDDLLSGGIDDDWLAGNGGADVLLGGDGSDWLLGGAGADHLDGGTGADSLVAEDGDDHLWGGDGDDRLFGDSPDRPLDTHGVDHLYGGAGNDLLVGHGGGDVLEGDAGSDTLFGDTGDDRLVGGEESDELYGGAGADLLDGGHGTDTLAGEEGDDTLIGGLGDDALYGDAGDDVLSGDAGRDFLSGGEGTDRYLFRRGDGFDRLDDVAGDNRLAFGAGIEERDIGLIRLWDGSFLLSYGLGDAVQLAAGTAASISEIAFASGGAVSFTDLVAAHLTTPLSQSGTNSADRLQGGLADDRLWGYDGDDWLAGSAGDDELTGDAGADTLHGGAGADRLDGGAGDDLLVGGPGDDTLYGNYGSDRYLFTLGDGHDVIAEYGDLGSTDTLAFGEGIAPDNLRYLRQPSGDLQILVGSGEDSVTLREWYAQPRHRVEYLAFADGQVIDTAFLNELPVSPQHGTPDADTLVGTEHADVILADAGDDLVDGGYGNDTLDGGAGADTYVLGIAGGLDTIDDVDRGGTLLLTRGLWFDELARERDGDDLVVRLAGSTQTGVRIAGYYAQPSAWQVLTESGATRGIEEIAEARWWGSATDPVAQAKADYLAGLHADFLERMDWFGYTRGGENTVDHIPVTASVASYHHSTQVTVTDYATGTVGQLQYSSVSGPDLEWVVYESGDRASTYWDVINGHRVSFVVKDVALEGSYIQVKNWFQQTTQTTAGQLWFTPEETYVDLREPEQSVTWKTIGNPLPNGVSGIRLEDKTTLTAVTRTEGSLGATGTLAFDYNFHESDFTVERLIGNDGDNGLYTGRATHSILEGGAGNDTLCSTGNWSWGTAGLFFDGGAGNDHITGGIHGDRVTGGRGGDWLNGNGGADRYLIDVAAPGFDLIDDTGSLWVDMETGWSVYKTWYYRSLGLDTSGLASQVFGGPALPAIPRADATDFAALTAFFDSGSVPLDEVWFAGDLRPADLVVSWGYQSRSGYYGGLRATLNISWGDEDTGLRIVLPPPPVASSSGSFTEWVQPDWFLVERGVGLGVERFRFGDGQVLSMAELLALAPPAPLHPLEVLTPAQGTDGVDHLVAVVAGGWLLGAGGDDTLEGSASPDVLDGGSGNDRLVGGAGSDLYLFDTGDGQDVLVENGAQGEIDVIQVGSGPDVLTTEVVRSGDDLVLRFDTAGDGITIRGWYASPAARVEQVIFEEGWVWDAAELERRAVVENLAPVAVDPPPVAVTEDQPFRIALPAATFVDPEGEAALRFSATLADGAALPAWLSFDPAALAFTGSAPLDASGVYQIAVTATDSFGASAQAFLDLEVIDVNPPLFGADASETLTGSSYPDHIEAGGGNDQVYGGAGDDVLSGGAGADLLDGGDGNDRLLYAADGTWLGDRGTQNLGSPKAPASGGSALLGGRAASSDIFVGGAGDDVLVGTEGSDSVLLDTGLGVSRRPGEARISGVERFELGGGDDLLNLTSRHHVYGDVTADGGAGDDVLWTSAGHDRLLGGAGNDDLDGGAGDDTLYGGSGNDRLTGSGGNDVLEGGAGDDLLLGGRGADTYRYAAGDGADTISELGPPKEADRLVFTGDLTADRLWLEQRGDDLVFRVTGTDDSVTIEGWYLDDSHRVERIEGGDGRVLLAADVDRLVAAMAVFDAVPAGELTLPLGSVPVLAPVLAAAWQPAAA